MKEFRITLTDDEHEYLTKIKNKFNCKNNHDFVILAANTLASSRKLKGGKNGIKKEEDESSCTS